MSNEHHDAGLNIYRGDDGKHYWRIVANNGEIVADGSQGYASKQKAHEGVRAAYGVLARHFNDQ